MVAISETLSRIMVGVGVQEGGRKMVMRWGRIGVERRHKEYWMRREKGGGDEDILKERREVNMTGEGRNGG